MVYLDSASTTRPKFFAKDYAKYWMNPNSPHQGGYEARDALNEARSRIKRALGVKSGKVLFCRCATEAVEWLCRQFIDCGYSESCCSIYEHDSVFNSAGDCDPYVPPYDCDKIYFHQHINHITGTVFDIESISNQIQPVDAFFSSDITASLGHYPLPSDLDLFCDVLWFSGRKIHCETIGAIWLSDRLFKYLKYLEDDENHMIPGTPNVPAALALADAVEYAVNNAEINNTRYKLLVNKMCSMLLENNILYHIQDGEKENKTFAINALYLPNFNADALVQYLSNKQIYVSPGHSACADSGDYRVLEAFGLSREQAGQTIRVSFDEDTTEKDIEALVQGIVEFKKKFI